MELATAARRFLAHLAAERGAAAATLAAYTRDLRKYQEFCGQRGLDAITPADLATFRDGLVAGGLTMASAARTMAAVRGLHRFAALEGWTALDAAAQVAPPRPSRRLPKALTLAEVEALIEA
ncbi:MAG: site-specific integrase, partial [Bifidobacteriaceae bacterium]|nr:site-specific integrase [Bifidobacteriaceae bacterium]